MQELGDVDSWATAIHGDVHNILHTLRRSAQNGNHLYKTESRLNPCEHKNIIIKFERHYNQFFQRTPRDLIRRLAHLQGGQLIDQFPNLFLDR